MSQNPKRLIQGEIHIFPLPDLIQWLALTRRTGKLVMKQGASSVELYFVEGRIAAASTSDLIVSDTAEKVRALLGTTLAWRSGSFAFSTGALPVWASWADLRLSVETLLLEVAAQPDQGQEPGAGLGLDELAKAGGESKTFTPADALRLQVVDHMLKEDFKVPAMPQFAARVLELTRDENFSLRDLSDLVLTDQAVAARVLRYANSALRGGEREVNSIAVAVQRLGGDEVVNIVLAASLQARRPGRDLFAAERRLLWTHSSVAAFCARALAARVGLNQHLGFLCGLLMDFGMTVLYSLIQDVLGPKANHGQFPAQVIREIVQDYHPHIGRVVGEQWRLPQAVIEAMAHHHYLDEIASDNPYVALAALADLLTTFALNHPRAALEESLAGFSPEQLAAHPAGRLIELSTGCAAAVLVDLPRNLDQALELVVD